MTERLNEDGIGELRAGTMLGKYSLARLIGAGAMGAVYEGARDGTGDRVAIKVLAPRFAAVAPARERFLAEARIAQRVRHPNIVEITDAGDDGGRPYLVMELLDGEDLAQRLERSRLLPAEDAADILIPVCGAIAAAHQAGVTHRDLKPHNIFLLAGQGAVRPKVLDFGIALADGVGLPREAKNGDASNGEAKNGEAKNGDTKNGKRAVVGSPCYLAPEQVANSGAAGPASDQYALGVIAYECLTGQLPFDGETLTGVLEAIAGGTPRPPRALQPELPAGLDAVVLRAMNREPSERFASVTELGRALLPFASAQTRAAWEASFAAGSGGANSGKMSGELPTAPPTTTVQGAKSGELGSNVELPAEVLPAPRRRSLTSPAIEVEAATRSPFSRTLPPEEPDLSAVDDDLSPLDDDDLSPVSAPRFARPPAHQPWRQPDGEVPRLTPSSARDRLASVLADKRARVAGALALAAIAVVTVVALSGGSDPTPATAAPSWLPAPGSHREAAAPPAPTPTPKPALLGSAAPPLKPALGSATPAPRPAPSADVVPTSLPPEPEPPGADVTPAPVVAAVPTTPAVEPAPPALEIKPAPPAPEIKLAPPAVDPTPPKPAPAVAAIPTAPAARPAPPATTPVTPTPEKVRTRPADKASAGGEDEADANASKADRRPARDSDAKRRVPLLD